MCKSPDGYAGVLWAQANPRVTPSTRLPGAASALVTKVRHVRNVKEMIAHNSGLNGRGGAVTVPSRPMR